MLKRTNTIPPGGFLYVQKETGYQFREQIGLEDQAHKIATHRSANNLPRATLEEAIADLDRFTCDRLGNDPRFCADGSGPVTVNTATYRQSVSLGCSSCGGRKA